MTKDTGNSRTQNKERMVGFEIEYASVPLDQSAKLIQELFGGEIEKETEAEWKVTDTCFGAFGLEIDAEPIKTLSSSLPKEAARAKGVVGELYRTAADKTVEAVNRIGTKVVPFEIVTPPVPVSAIPELDKLREALHLAFAKDTRSSIYNAFGLHINPDVLSTDSRSILRHIQAFALLFPWLRDVHEMDATRSLSAFAEPYPNDYIDHIIAVDYAPSLEELIRDYHAFNPTRNRALDMLPLFAHLEPELVEELYGSEEKINARPTYHYRLPNCEVANGDWSLMKEWSRWLLVEETAENQSRLFQLCDGWHQDSVNRKMWLTDDDTNWKQSVDNIMRQNDVA